MYLQERIEELGSGILKFQDSRVCLIGFTCSERLYDYYNNGVLCQFSTGLYDLEPLDFSRIQDNALFIVKNGNKELRYQFKLIKKDIVKYKDEANKQLSKVYSIRECIYTNKFNYKDADVSILFDKKVDLQKYFQDRYSITLDI
jgi:hypothetical protein